MIVVGTSGYSYEDWKGVFYPPDLPNKDMLAYYSREFSFTEVNSSYYKMPNKFMFRHMADKTPPGFEFAVKANRRLTHEPDGDPAAFKAFREALSSLVERGKLGCVLAQFPSSFRNNDENRDYLRLMREELPGIPVVVEFRRREWIEEPTFELLMDEDLGFVCVDEPGFKGLVPPIVRATSRVGYVRFHGRNYKKWWVHDEPHERYDYLYSEDELGEWVPRILSLEERVDKVYVSMNNHYRGQAVINGRMLRDLLKRFKPEKPGGK